MRSQLDWVLVRIFVVAFGGLFNSINLEERKKTLKKPYIHPSLSLSLSIDYTSIIGPLQKTTNRQEYDKVVDGLMFAQGITKKEAEKEYNAYLDNPNNYALQKGEAYYKSLGYKKLMDGVIGEAEKEGA